MVVKKVDSPGLFKVRNVLMCSLLVRKVEVYVCA